MPIMPLSFFSPSISLVNPRFRYCSRKVHGGRESCKFLILVSNEALTNFAYDAENPSENYFFHSRIHCRWKEKAGWLIPFVGGKTM